MREVHKTVDVNARVTNIQCQIGEAGDMSKAVISFDNLGYGTITAVKFNAQGYNSFGDTVQINGRDKFFLIIQDIRIPPNSHAGDLKARMPSEDIRKLDLEECQICYLDGSISTYAGADSREFHMEQFEERGQEREILDAIQDELGEKVRYLPQEVEDGWVCGCGRYNRRVAAACSNCGNTKEKVFQIKDGEHIAALLRKHQQKEEARREQARQEEARKEKARRSRNIKIGIGAILAIVLAFFIGNAVIMAGRTTYGSKEEMRAALQGKYTYYEGDRAMRQIEIKGDQLRYIYRYVDSTHWTGIDWYPDKGMLHTFEDIIVTSDGDLKADGDLFEKGGYMSTESSYGSTYSPSYESAASVLKFSGVQVSSNSSYTICTGTLKNTGKKTYDFVEVKGAFKDSSGNVVDTDWTYAVGSEGLAPGEATTFRMSVPKNNAINSCSVSILDYD